MRRRKILQTLLSNTNKKLSPYIINTLYDQNPNDLTSPAQNIQISLNRFQLSNTLSRIKLTAAQAQCALLAATQVSKQINMFVINKQIKSTNYWINDEYSDPSSYQAFINSQILSAKDLVTSSKQQSVSFPFIIADIRRFKYISVSFINDTFQLQTRQLSDQKAFAFQQGWDYSVSRNILDWRLHLGNIQICQNAKQHLPKTTLLLQQYCNQIKTTIQKYPYIVEIPQQFNKQQLKNWLQSRGYNDFLSFQQDTIQRLHKNYRKQMLIFLQRIQNNLL